MTLCNVVDQLHDKHCLTNTSTTEQANLTTFHIRLQQVNHLNTGRKDFFLGRQFFKRRCLAMDRIRTLHVQVLHTIDRFADHVKHSAFNLFACRHLDRCTHRDCFQSTLQAIGIVHSNTANGVLTNVLLHFDNEFLSVATINTKGFVNFWQHFLGIQSFGIEIHVDNGTNNLGNASCNL